MEPLPSDDPPPSDPPPSDPSPAQPFDWRAALAEEEPWLLALLRRSMSRKLRRFTPARDLVQEVFADALRHEEQAAALDREETRRWLAIIAKSKRCDAMRLLGRGGESLADLEPADPAEAPALDADEGQLVRGTLEALPERDGRLARARVLEERTWPEIAAAEGISRTAAQQAWKRVERGLQRALRGLGRKEP